MSGRAESGHGGPRAALRIQVSGTVQGVGFRPFVYRAARRLGLVGTVCNSMAGVTIEVAGPPPSLKAFREALMAKAPAAARIQQVHTQSLDPAAVTATEFRITPSDSQADAPAPVIPADLATCPQCRAELADPANPRYRYPFINCTECGPRFSIIESLPYDRARTTMRAFPLSQRCRREYEDPMDRRFHAEPNADADAGPSLAFVDSASTCTLHHEEALQAAATRLRRGGIVAVKGLGGFHLMVRADQPDSVRRLRERKAREAKPLAVMMNSLRDVRKFCKVDPAGEQLLTDPAAPIVLLPKLDSALWPEVSAFSTLGVLLPYTPLHILLLQACPHPLVATSGNLSDEPICIDNQEAMDRLGPVADAFLIHDRPIARPVDDSVADVIAGQPRLLRRSRGYAPLPLSLPGTLPPTICVGGDLKNTVAVAWDRQAVLSQHIGDLANQAAEKAHRDARRLLAGLFDNTEPRQVMRDAHPQYRSTDLACAYQKPTTAVQHHEAHAYAVLTECDLLRKSALCHVWDGTGYSPDGTVHGGESFLWQDGRLRRVATLRPFVLIGGDAAATQPWRPAMAMLFACLGIGETLRSPWPSRLGLSPQEATNFATAYQRNLQAIPTSSMGRLFDAVAALTGLAASNRFQGEAAMRLEDAISSSGPAVAPYPFPLRQEGGRCQFDWEPLLRSILHDHQNDRPAGHISARFHLALIESMQALMEPFPVRHVCLTGGCFQNRFLLRTSIQRLRRRGLGVHWPRAVPCNDGGLAYGQACAAALLSPNL